jgi:plasmid stabilization system protein ParE
MPYRVEFAARAARDLESLYEEKNAAECQATARWYNGLEEAVYALAEYPNRCPVAHRLAG